jgi:hypothetical protein
MSTASVHRDPELCDLCAAGRQQCRRDQHDAMLLGLLPLTSSEICILGEEIAASLPARVTVYELFFPPK